MQHVYLANYHISQYGWGYSSEAEGQVTILAETASAAKELAKVELQKANPKAEIIVEMVQAIGY